MERVNRVGSMRALLAAAIMQGGQDSVLIQCRISRSKELLKTQPSGRWGQRIDMQRPAKTYRTIPKRTKMNRDGHD
ncbi:hypothetical protein BOTBODRAFT_473376 [Botryobasidium botryosum FD-172 SS1]|uniref:Uncharacterized protein n=1 Tax=Botryobasidium botryosum (strain FD-172 SS1) TaxID=930990 RepID=A0A067M4T7_BOTB1|nr:hypothetical protein BOTBODRAFT_473376 [Botryobasidium botryosum FD-172 SS1]